MHGIELEEDIEWWRPVYTQGNGRKAGPWFRSLVDAKDWTSRRSNLTDVMRRTVRYEAVLIHVEGSPEGVAAALAKLVTPP